MAALHRTGMAQGLLQAVQAGKPLLGICVGLQVLFEEGEEMGRHKGLSLLPGRVVRFSRELAQQGLKVPHTGWNQVEPAAPTPLLHGLEAGRSFYFNHAYYGQATPEQTLALTGYGEPFASVVGRDNVFGVQFHPEKSQRAGLQIMSNFVERVQ
jgi:glutamine amidotransferase